MVVCLAYKHSLSIIILVAHKTVVILILAIKEKRLPFTVKKTINWKMAHSKIREIFVTLILVRSRKYFQLFCFNSCPFFYQRTGWA